METLATHYRSRAILSGNNGKRSKDQGEYLREYFLTYASPEPLRGLHTELEALQKQKEAAEKPIPTAMVMAELSCPRAASSRIFVSTRSAAFFVLWPVEP